MSTGRQDLDAILDTVREVEASLEKRVARAEGANILVWTVAVAGVFAFYQLVAWEHARWHDLLGPFLPWVWVGPLAVAYVASAIIGARLGRATKRRDAGAGVRRGLLSGFVATVAAVALVLTERYDAIYGTVTLICGFTTFAFKIGAAPSLVTLWSRVVGVGMTLAGVALVVWPTDLAPLLAALAVLVGLGSLGTVRYRLGG